jgi:hypothetical protein
MRTGDLVAFEQNDEFIEFEAQSDTAFVLGSGAMHSHKIHMGTYSVHTRTEALRTGQEGIRDRAALLRHQRRLQLNSRLKPTPFARQKRQVQHFRRPIGMSDQRSAACQNQVLPGASIGD